MAEEKFGTNAVTGLNVAKGPHLIEDHELRESYNGWTDEDGVWRTAPGPSRLYSGYSAISCLAAGRMGGADHVVWLDGNTLYDNGVNVGTITAGTTMDIVALDDVFLILGAAKNYIWDGTHLREQGTWQPEYMSCESFYDTATARTITGATQAAACVVTLDVAHNFHVLDKVYIDSVVGMTELNGKYFNVTAVSTYTITLDVDSTAFTPYGSGGTADARHGYAGTYRWAITTTIELSDGKVLEGKLRNLKVVAGGVLDNPPLPVRGPDDTWDSDAVTVAADDQVMIGFDYDAEGYYFRMYLTKDSVSQYTCSGTQGTDWIPGIRIYRTKSNGTDFYLLREMKQGDTDVTTFSSGGDAGVWFHSFFDGTSDTDLGAVYEPDQYDHGNATQSDVGAFAGQRVLIASGHNIYWSDLDGIEYYNNANGFTPLGDVVTAIAPFREGWAVFSCDRLWLVQILDGLPDIVEINTPVGTVWPKAMCTVDDGVLFLRDDGLWLFTGARVEKISRGAFSSITSPQSVTAAGEMLFVSGSEKSYVALRRDGGWVWHESEHFRPYADSTNGKIYAAGLFHVEQMFAGRYAGGRLSTKHFGNRWLGKAIRVVLDFEGDTIPTVWVNGNRQSDVLGHVDDSSTQYRGRRVVRVSVPRLNNQFLYLTLETTGDCKVYGYEVEVAG